MSAVHLSCAVGRESIATDGFGVLSVTPLPWLPSLSVQIAPSQVFRRYARSDTPIVNNHTLLRKLSFVLTLLLRYLSAFPSPGLSPPAGVPALSLALILAFSSSNLSRSSQILYVLHLHVRQWRVLQLLNLL